MGTEKHAAEDAQEVTTDQAVLTDQDRMAEASRIVRKNMYWSAGFGILPVPVLDLAGVFAFQIKMLADLCKLYDVPFRRDTGKNLVSALIGGLVPSTVSMPVASTLKFIPVVGHLRGAVTMPAISAASTYAVGKVFIQHFECGGTLLTFDPQQVKDYFAEQFKEGEALASQTKK